MTKQKLKNKLLKRAQFATKLLSYVPFIRMVAINGSLASGKINDDSDIDFFLISENKHLWTARFFAIGILTFFNLRAKGKRHEHKVCLNHILSNFDYKISFKNHYNAMQYSRLKILFDIDDQHQKFIEANTWMKRFGKLPVRFLTSKKRNIIQRFLEYLFKDSEYKFKERQLQKISQNPFYKQSDSVKSFSDNEFYFYTNVSRKWRKPLSGDTREQDTRCKN